MTVPNVTSVTTPTSGPSNGDLVVNLPTGDPTGKLLLAVVHDYAIGGPNPPNEDWLTVVRGDAVSVFAKIGELADSGGTITFRAFSQEVVTPDNTGYVIEVNNATGVDAVSALAKGTGSFAFAPGVTTHYNDELQIDLMVAERKSGTPTYPFVAYTQIVEHQPGGGCEVFAETRTQATPGHATGGDVDFNVSSRWRSRTIAVVGNRPPQASTNLNPGNTGSTVVIDDTVNEDFTWRFNDPDPQDTQSAYDFGLTDVTAATAESVTHVVSSTSSHTVTAGGLTDGHTYKWRVRTYDAAGLVGPWTAQVTFVAHDPPPAPTVTFPTAGYTVTTHSVGITASDTATAQQQWEARVVADNAGSPDPSTIYSDQTSLTSSGLEAAFPPEVNGLTVHVQVRVLAQNLWSAWTSVSVDVDFVHPPTSEITSIEQASFFGELLPGLTIEWSTPAPTGGEPAVDHVDIWISEDDGDTATRYATDLPATGSWTFWTPASGVNYWFQVVTVAADGASAATDWVSEIVVTPPTPPPPANDDWANALAVGGFHGPFSNRGATMETGEPPVAFGGAGTTSVWFKYTATADGLLTVNLTTGSYNDFGIFETQCAMDMWEGTSLAGLTQVGVNPLSGATTVAGNSSGGSLLCHQVSTGDVVYIRVVGASFQVDGADNLGIGVRLT